MKLIFEANDQEKKEIIEQHNFFKKTLKTKLKQKLVNEQTSQTSGGGVEFLKAAREKGCKIAVGGVIRSAPGKPSVLYKVADYDSTNGYFKKGDELYIKDDFTFDVVSVDGSGKKRLSASNKNWACSALTKPVEDQVKVNFEKSQKEQMEFISGATKVGYLQTLTPEQKATGLYKKYKMPGSEEFFPPNGIEMFYDPLSVKNKDISTNIDTKTKANTPDNIKVCKADIESYYTNYTKKRPMSDFDFNGLKNRVQTCKNEFYGDWGVLSGGRKIDKLLDIMSGGNGGPSRRGENSQWKLN